MIIFSVSALEKAPVTLRGTEGIEFFELDENDSLTVSKELQYELTGSKVSGGILIHGKCTTAVSGICGRCLEEIENPVEASIDLFFDPEEIPEELDVSEDVREEVLLTFPMNLLCSNDCEGLCRNCGGNLNRNECTCNGNTSSGDFRWSALDSLKL